MANSPANERRLGDATLTASIALPNAANTVNTNAIDLKKALPYPVTEHFVIKVTTTAATGANSKNINFRIMDSADNITFANVALIGNPFLQTTSANDVYPAVSAQLQLPPTIKRYVRVTGLGEANGGVATDGTVTIAALF